MADAAADMPEPDLPALLLSRAAFGARPGDVEHARDIGPDAWIEEQLDFESIDDSAVEDRLRNELPSLSMTNAEILDYTEDARSLAVTELRLARLYEMVYSKRLLHEAMVEFWSDHFNIHHLTGMCRYFKTVDERDVIRHHALGKFRDLLTASAQSPAMLNYLNNDVNTRGRPNENYAREIMELHTLGVSVDGYPYTEEDVKEVAKCLTGWTWDRRKDSPTRAEYLYVDSVHDQGPKNVLGELIPAGMREQDGHMVIDLLCKHEATPRFLATKLVRRFVTDDPLGETPDLVDRVAEAYKRTDGDIKEMMSTILRSREFASSFAGYGGRLSRPMDMIARAMRVTNVPEEKFSLSTGRGNRLYRRLATALASMGHVPWFWLTPDGYPDVKEAWAASSVMLTRWNFELSLAGAGSGRLGYQLVDGFTPITQTPAEVTTAGQYVDYWIDRLLHRDMVAQDRSTVVSFMTNGGDDSTPIAGLSNDRRAATIALILDSPYFMWR
jgi:uncharacterized protein (DUF1800 family)